jgi:hypothetical protein
MSEFKDYDIAGSVRELMSKAAYLDDGHEKISLLEEAVRIADTGHDLKIQYHAREEFLEAAFWGGEADKALVAYSWCLAQFDKNPGEFSEWNLLWRYKWIVNIIIDFPQIPKEQIYRMLDEMERRYQQAGYGLRVVTYYRYRTEKFFGFREKALRYYERAKSMPRDLLSDCPACETDEKVSHQIYCGADDVALRIASPLIEGHRSCRSVPQRTFANILIPLVRLGRWEEAYALHLRGYNLIAGKVSLLSYLCEHLHFLGLYGDFEKGTQILEKHFGWSTKNTNIHDRYLFYRAALAFLDLMIDSGRESITLQLPESFPLESDNNVYRTSRLKDWFESRTREIGEKFDKRNGSDHFQQELAEKLALKEMKRGLNSSRLFKG